MIEDDLSGKIFNYKINMIDKLARTIEMSFDIPEAEKEVARTASKLFEQVDNALEHATKHLDIMYNPFSKSDDIPKEALLEFRGAIRQYKDQVKKNFEKVKSYAVKAIGKLNFFASDFHIKEIINSFKDAVGLLEVEVNKFLEILDDLKSPDFTKKSISSIDSIKKECEDVENLIKERIIEFIDANILAKDWVSSVSDELHVKIDKRVPYITQLFQERQEALESLKY